MDGDGVALAAVISSSVLGGASLWVGIWTTLKSSKDAEKTRRAERSAGAYLDLLRHAQSEGHYYEVLVTNLQITREDEYAGAAREPYPDLPGTQERVALDANLAAFGSREVLALYTVWRESVVAIAAEKADLEFVFYENYQGVDTPVGDVTRMKTLLPAERTARRALADRIALELGHRKQSR